MKLHADRRPTGSEDIFGHDSNLNHVTWTIY